MKLNINVLATLAVHATAPALLQIEIPAFEGSQSVLSSHIYCNPYVELHPYVDIYGNLCRRALLPEGEVEVRYEATVVLPEERAPSVQAGDTDILTLPPEMIHYLLPSRYCPSDRMAQFALAEFGNTEPGYARVQAICSWIYNHVTYEYGVSTTATTAFETATERKGVCRDFAHLGISLCRALNIPARYVSGYCLDLDPPDFHAFFQVYLDSRWVTFDATTVQPRAALVTVALGRDAADCAWCSFFGPGETSLLQVDVAIDSTPDA